jgi:acetyl esterase
MYCIERKPKMINPELHPFLERWDQEWSTLKPGATAADRREHFEIIAKKMRLPTPDGVNCDVERWVACEFGDVRVRIFRHESSAPQPCLIYLHGGAFMQGSPETHWDITARFAAWNKQTVISVDYALAPENAFPIALEQVDAVVRWAVRDSKLLGIDPDRISIGGDSAGGQLAAAATLDLRGEAPLIAQVLIYPVTDWDRSRPSYAENPDGPIVRPSDLVGQLYCPDESLRQSPRVVPLHAKSHAGLPPAFVSVAEHDPLRDSGVAYAEALKAANVPVVLDMGKGLIHGYLRGMDYCVDSMNMLKKISAWLAVQNAA